METKALRLGFAGVGWIGRHRMDAAALSGIAQITAIADPSSQAARDAASTHPGAAVVASFEDLLEEDLDGVVIATPSALHADQAISALQRGIPVFCQKPLGRSASEVGALIHAARQADRLLGVDLSYRFTDGMQQVRNLIRSGELGEITSIEAVFHNAYGPDKPWFYSRKKAGGGCLLDLGVHLVDLAMWSLDFPAVRSVSGWTRESHAGQAGDRVENHAAGLVRLAPDTNLQLACSWGSHAGCDAEIRLQFFGTRGGAVFRNSGGSFHDFVAERFFPDRSREMLSEPPDGWGGRTILDWVQALSRSPNFDPEICHLTRVAATLDELYLETL